jgi:hypothetical protein
VLAFLPLPGTQAFQARPTRVEYGPRRQPQPYKIVAVLSGEDEIVLAAIEAPAQDRAAIIDRASRSAKIHALTIRLGGQQKHWISCGPIRHNPMRVRLDFIPLFRMENQALITPAALSTPVAGHARLFVWNQTPV